VDRYWAFAIARACHALTGDEFRVYSVILDLDRPERGDVGGCYMAELELAQQAGVSLDYGRRVRRTLATYGLVHRVEVAGTRADFWFADLPQPVDRVPPGGARVQEKRAWVREQADALSAHIRAVKLAGQTSPGTERLDAQTSPGYARAPGELYPDQALQPGKVSHVDRQSLPGSERGNGGFQHLNVTLKPFTERLSQSRQLQSDTERTRSENGTDKAAPRKRRAS
jgi:hypothetical protein